MIKPQTVAATAGSEINFKKIDFNLVKERFSLSGFCRDEGFNVIKRSRDSYVFCCAFHDEDTASCHIFDDRRYKCFGCGAKGTIIDLVLKLKPYLGMSPAAAANYLIAQNAAGHTKDFELETKLSRSISAATTIAAPPITHRLKVDRAKILASNSESLTAVGDQIFNPQYQKARQYAESRGWLKAPAGINSYQLGAMMAGEGLGFLSREPAVAFPKLIQTKRTAEVFGLEKEFENNDRVLCAGIKKRLLPETIHKWESMAGAQQLMGDKEMSAPRWICKPGFVTEIPWEFDSNEDADILIVTEGPGDGLRLFNEANATEEIQERWGRKWHIMAVDSCHIWTVNSIPRRPVTWGSQNFTVGLFDGFKHVIVLFDGDAPGQSGAKTTVELVKRQNPQAIVRNVCLAAQQDVNDFFDADNKMSDLAELFRAAPVVV